ncbi:hypothetical protein C1H46_002868 [Malus baccata]|uniref:Uncharacterized protein n=1 Tax=Malus baccata TaxID=106549 RepID=A0A540NLG4_MALBA|nr:hypothetical protein C1H46_002868 [Malus baccata]
MWPKEAAQSGYSKERTSTMENVWWEVNPIHHNHKSCLQSRNQAKIEGLPGFGKKTPTKIGGLSAKSGRKEGETRGSTKEGAWWAGKGRKLGREAEDMVIGDEVGLINGGKKKD